MLFRSVLEPSCLLTLRDEALVLGLGEAAHQVAASAQLFEEFLAGKMAAGELDVPLAAQPGLTLKVHGHCHQKSMGKGAPAVALLSKVPGAKVTALDSGCCGMAGSFGYVNYEVSQAIGERRLLPAARGLKPGAVLVAAGT